MKKMKKTKIDCRYVNECAAPMCPKSEDILKMTWFADEDTCRLHDVPEWVKRQKKIAKNKDVVLGVFTLKMLQRDCKISKKLNGVDPDHNNQMFEKRINDWLESHPVKKSLSTAELEKRRSRMNQVRSEK